MNGAPRVLASLVLALLAFPAGARAGDEGRVVVVVNGRSPLSRALAAEYCRLRSVPAEQVLLLDDVPGTGVAGDDTISLGDCTTRILAPLCAFLAEHTLDTRVDTVAFSAGFPYSVDFSAKAQELGLSQAITPTASLTGMCYFARSLLRGETDAFALDGNGYFRSPGSEANALSAAGEPWPALAYSPVTAFRSDGGSFEDEAVLRGKAGNGRGGYLLASFLGWMGVRGHSLPQVEEQMRRAVAADGTHPDGTVYLLENGDVRATTRMPLFETAAALLRARGREVVVLRPGESGQDGIVPRERDDVIGAVIGSASYPWDPSSRLLPGAIAESLTSFGAFFGTSSQTKLTEMLAAGAAGSSGTVREPFAIQAKFPTPLIHVYYADGCNLAEAFYQSVQGPYQLLVVGDPLCRPFGPPPSGRDSTASPSTALRSLAIEFPVHRTTRTRSRSKDEADPSLPRFAGFALEQERGAWHARTRWKVPAAGVYEIGLRHRGAWEMVVDGESFAAPAASGSASVFSAGLFALEEGEVLLEVKAKDEPDLRSLRCVGPAGTVLPEELVLATTLEPGQAGPALRLAEDDPATPTLEVAQGSASTVAAILVPGGSPPESIEVSADGKRYRTIAVKDALRLVGREGDSYLLRVRASKVKRLRIGGVTTAAGVLLLEE